MRGVGGMYISVGGKLVDSNGERKEVVFYDHNCWLFLYGIKYYTVSSSE